MKLSEINTYEQFVEEMKSSEFQIKLHFALRTLLKLVEEDSSYLAGNDKRIVEYWLKYQDDPTTPKPVISMKQ